MATALWSKIFAVTIIKNGSTVIQNKLLRVTQNIITFKDMLDASVTGPMDYSSIKVCLTKSGPTTSKTADSSGEAPVTVLCDDEISLAVEFDKSLNCVTYCLTTLPDDSENDEETLGDTTGRPTCRTVNEALKWPKQKSAVKILPTSNKRDEMHNVLVDKLTDLASFPSTLSDSEITKVLKTVTSLIWYMDGRQKYMIERQKKECEKLATKIPQR